MHKSKKDIEKLIALSFDSDPKIRLKAATELSSIDDAGANLVIMELAYDKDPTVSNYANAVLLERKKKPADMLPFNELFKGVSFAAEEKQKEQTYNKKVLEPIFRIFMRKLGDKKKAEKAMDNFMQKLKKIKVNTKTASQTETLKAYKESFVDYIEHINPINNKVNNKEVNTSAISNTDTTQSKRIVTKASQNIIQNAIGKTQTVSSGFEVLEDKQDKELQLIGSSMMDVDSDQLSKESAEIDNEDFFTIEEKKAIDVAGLIPKTVFKMAYDNFIALEGDEKLMKKQAELLQKYVKKEVDLAYSIAKKKFKEIKLTDISNIKNGMRNINTDLLEVIKVQNIRYFEGKRVKKEMLATRVLLKDLQGKEGVLYLFEDRGKYLQPGMKITLEKAKAKLFKFSDETALTVDKRGKVKIEF